MSFKLGVTLYSFTNEYCTYKWSFEDCVQKASELGPGQGLEIVGPQSHRGFPYVGDEFERQFKSAVQRYGVVPTSYGSYADPGMIPGRNLTDDELLEYTIPQIEGAAKLGFPIVRLQYFVYPIVERLLPYARKYKLKLGYELHVPLELENEETHKLMAHVRSIDSEYLGVIPDCGLFCRQIPKAFLDEGVRNGIAAPVLTKIQDLWKAKVSEEKAHEEIKAAGGDQIADIAVSRCWALFGHSDPSGLGEIIKYVIHSHGKFFQMVGSDEPNVRYAEVVAAYIKAGYRGFLSSEFEGHQFSEHSDSFAQVKAQQSMVKKYMTQYGVRSF